MVALWFQGGFNVQGQLEVSRLDLRYQDGFKVSGWL